jgi:hypothetical protein
LNAIKLTNLHEFNRSNEVTSLARTHKNAIPVTAICSPHLNSLVAVDAAVRHIAHHIKADVVILDPADLAAGRQGVFGAGS